MPSWIELAQSFARLHLRFRSLALYFSGMTLGCLGALLTAPSSPLALVFYALIVATSTLCVRSVRSAQSCAWRAEHCRARAKIEAVWS